MLLALLGLSATAQSTGSASHNGLMRVENEYKLHVPDAIADTLWRWLVHEFGPEHCVLRERDSSFTSKLATDRMVDQYFDDEQLRLREDGNSVRLRSRQVLSDTLDRKHGRRLMQVKINRVDDNALNRGEYKFKPDTLLTDSATGPIERHPFLGLVLPSHRDSLRSVLSRYGITGDSLRPTALIDQLRRRIYISRDTIPFATLSLDAVRGTMSGRSCTFTELELELNENGYTSSDSTERLTMERVNEFIKEHVVGRWPEVRQDQRPKYGKVSDGIIAKEIEKINASVPKKDFRFPWLKVISWTVLLIGLIALAVRQNRRPG